MNPAPSNPVGGPTDAAQVKHVVVQAGGRGSRMRHHTWNKPKCLISVEGKPILYQLFERFPGASFVVISDYSYETLERYLRYNPPKVEVKLIRAGGQGTCGGLQSALDHIPEHSPFILAWSDIIIDRMSDIAVRDGIQVAVSPGILCRWSLDERGCLVNVPSSERGVLGLFLVADRDLLRNVPTDGEFVQWLAASDMPIDSFSLEAREIGEFTAVDNINERQGFTRFFNRIDMTLDTVVKTATIPAYEDLIDREVAWYEQVRRLGFGNVPRLLKSRPLTLRRIDGRHPFDFDGLSKAQRRVILAAIMDALTELHELQSAPAEADDIAEAYRHKTINRVMSARLMLPTLDCDVVTVNGRKCRNPFSVRYEGLLEEFVDRIRVERFAPIHGDPTFSNTLIDADGRPWFIDPRGYFARQGIFGDPNYDWAKLYYSVVGGYDGFNRRRLKLIVDHNVVEVLLEPNAWTDMAALMEERLGGELGNVKLIHALIWLSLAGWVSDDVDSIIGAFHLGLWWLEEAIS